LIERYFITVSPALVLTGIVAVDLLFGTIAILLSAPIAVTINTAVEDGLRRRSLRNRRCIAQHEPAAMFPPERLLVAIR
jgi:predicted PurR-regulated permease PerM